MNTRKLSSMVLAAAMTALLSLSGGFCFAANGNQKNLDKGGLNGDGKHSPARAASPDLEKKREMVRKQQEQRITPEKRKAAAKALQAERLRVYEAKQKVKNTPIDNNPATYEVK